MGKRKAEIAAIEDIKKRISRARNVGHMTEVANLLNQLGNQYRLLQLYEDALDAHREEAQVSAKYNKEDMMSLGIAYRNMAEVYIEMNNYPESIKFNKKYLKIAQDVGNLVEQQRAYITLGRAHLSMEEEGHSDDSPSQSSQAVKGPVNKARICFHHAYELLKLENLKDSVNDDKEYMLMKCNNCQNLGVAFNLLGNSSTAEQWIERAVAIGKKYNFNEYLAPCNLILGGIWMKQKKIKEALNAARDATKAAKALDDQTIEVESLILEAKALFMLDDLDHGKKILKRLREKIRKKVDLHGYCEELESLLTAAVRISRYQDQLFNLDHDDPEAKMKLHERIADNYCELNSFQSGVKYYKSACQYAEKLGLQGKKLAKLYFSVAETYMDLENHRDALDYFMKEIRVHIGNPVEEFKTQQRIAKALEGLGKSPEVVVTAHELAYSYAKLTEQPKKELIALENFADYLDRSGRVDEADKRRKLAEEIKTAHSIQSNDESEPDPDSQDLLADDDEDIIDLDDLSDDDDSDVEEDQDKSKRKPRISVRVNESGESKLHVCAKKGDLKGVRRLLRQGHPVNVKDHAKWTPLHEACNFGHAEVVEELLKHGANVNETGMDKITPLHDAAGNCHSTVMKILMEHGANVIAKDIQGKYPIDSLMDWRESDLGRGCSETELVAYREVKEILKDRMAIAGKPYREEDETRARKRARKNRGSSPTHAAVLLVTKPYEKDCPVPATTIVDDFDPDQEGNGAEMYKKTMKQMGRKSLEDGGKKKGKGRPISPGPQGPLIPSDKDFHQKHEDWLLPDDAIDPTTPLSHVATKSKRKRNQLEDSHLQKRSTRRRTISTSSNNRREKDNDEEDELMDIGTPTNPYPENETSDTLLSPTNSPLPPDSCSEELPRILDDFQDEDYSNLLDDDNDDIVVGLDMDNVPNHRMDNDDCLPSQMPVASRVEFGRTIDIPDDDDDDFVGMRDKRRKSSPTKRYGAVLSSSDDEDQPTPTNRTKLSNLSSVMKQAGCQRNKSLSLKQTRLPVKVLHRSPPRRSDSNESIDSIVHVSSSPAVDHSASDRRPHLNSIQRGVPTTEDKPRMEPSWLKFKIKIGDKVLLVPVDSKHASETIDWLAKECSARYFRSYGVKPNLMLHTKDGAVLCGSDPINLVLGMNESELEGEVISLDLPPLVDRYSKACSEASIEVDQEIKSHLNDCQSSNTLNLTDLPLRKSSNPVMSALQRQTSLKVLVLSGCSLFDPGLLELCKILPTLSGLTELDLSSNGITKVGFTALSDTFSKEVQANDSVSFNCTLPLGLTTLILNHNPLGDKIGPALANLIQKLSHLKRLEMSDCDLSEKLLVSGKQELVKAVSNSKLEEFDISFNVFKDVGLERLLQSLPARRLRSLNCSSCVLHNNSTPGSDVVIKALRTFLSGNEDCCNLKSLRLNDCGFDDKSLEALLENFNRLVRLETVELACNPGLTAFSLVNVLNCCVENEIPLGTLDLGCIPNFWNSPRTSPDEVVVSITNKLQTPAKISHLRVPVSPVDANNANMHGEINSQPILSSFEEKVDSIMSDCAGLSEYHCKKQGVCISYVIEDV